MDRDNTQLVLALGDPLRRGRYEALVCPVPLPRGCLVWMGAVSGAGHGRFWLGGGRVTIAHRFGFALAHGIEALLSEETVRHTCDEPICQNVNHMAPGSIADNTVEGITRRLTIGNPLRDTRGPRGRALALRNAARTNPATLAATAAAGTPLTDTLQTPLW